MVLLGGMFSVSLCMLFPCRNRCSEEATEKLCDAKRDDKESHVKQAVKMASRSQTEVLELEGDPFIFLK